MFDRHSNLWHTIARTELELNGNKKQGCLKKTNSKTIKYSLAHLHNIYYYINGLASTFKCKYYYVLYFGIKIN